MSHQGFNNSYAGKRVLVTGHTGFKGSWLAIWLKELGAEVVGYALDPPSEPDNFSATALKDRITHVHGDILNFNQLMAVVDKYRPEYVFHLAAQAVVRQSYENPKETLDVNIGGTINVLEAVRLSPSVRVLVNVTSDKCYENREWLWGYRENDPLGGSDPYSASKGCAELVFGAYLKSFFGHHASGRSIGAASVRAGNVIGGGDWGRDRLIPDCVRALSMDKPVAIRNPEAVRPWQHVLEALSGYLWLGAQLWKDPQKYGGAWNIGPGGADSIKTKDLVAKLIAAWGKGTWEDQSDPRQPYEAMSLRLYCDKAWHGLQWRCILPVSECLQWTVDWYKQYNNTMLDKYSMYDLCVEQIQAYENRARREGLAWTK